MANVAVHDLTNQIGAVYQVVTRLEKRLAELEIRQPGKIRTDHPHIVRVQGVCSGRPIIEGTRLSVKLIVGWVRMGMTTKDILAQYPGLTAAEIADALAYYDAHPEEIEAEFLEEERYLTDEIPRLQTMVAKRYEQKN
jgi:uncharacterized protein (DUF433 family)